MSDGIADGHEYSNGRSLTGDNRRYEPNCAVPQPDAIFCLRCGECIVAAHDCPVTVGEHSYERSGVALIAAERQRQVDVEGWTSEHDDEHFRGEMAAAAACYAFHVVDPDIRDVAPEFADTSWPWSKKWWKPSADPIRNLVKAGALIAAEIDRLQRAATRRP